MNDDFTFPLRRIWLVSILVAVVIATPLSFFSRSHPWLIGVPIVIGVSALCIMEIFAETVQQDPQLPLIKSPAGYFGLAKFKGHVAMVTAVEKSAPNQKTFDFLNIQRKKSTKPTRIIRDPETGEEIYLIDTEKFVSMFLTHVLPVTDQITEMSLLHALHRFGEMEGVSSEFEKFLRSKAALEIIKADFRSNTAQTINTAGERVLREAVQGLKDTKGRKIATTPQTTFLQSG